MGRAAFRARLREDFAQLVALLAQGVPKPQIAACLPLEKVAAAMDMAESQTVYGKVILVPSNQ